MVYNSISIADKKIFKGNGEHAKKVSTIFLLPLIRAANVKSIAKPSNPYIYLKGSGGSLSPSV